MPYGSEFQVQSYKSNVASSKFHGRMAKIAPSWARWRRGGAKLCQDCVRLDQDVAEMAQRMQRSCNTTITQIKLIITTTHSNNTTTRYTPSCSYLSSRCVRPRLAETKVANWEETMSVSSVPYVSSVSCVSSVSYVPNHFGGRHVQCDSVG